MGKMSFTLAILKPEIASGVYRFSPPTPDKANGSSSAPVSSRADDLGDDEDQSQTPLRSAIASVSAVDASLLYPDGQILTNIFTRIAQAGFLVQRKRMVQLSKAHVRSLFAHETLRLKDELTYREFLESFTSGLSMALLLAYPASSSADDAVTRWKQLAGPDNPALARQDALSASQPHDEWPLRALCGLNAVQNAIQSSASLDCFYRERRCVFPEDDASRMESAIILLLPSFMSALPDGKALLLGKLNAGGVLVVRRTEDYRFASVKELGALQRELHPVTNAQHREEHMLALQQAADMEEDSGTSNSSCCLLEVDALDLTTKLRCILGPTSIEDGHLQFPESVRAQLSKPLVASLDHVRTAENDATCLESGLFVSFDPRTIAALSHQASHDPVQRTFAIIKPGTASDPLAVHDIQAAIRAFGFSIDKQRRLRLTRAQAAAFYGEHRGKAFFERLLLFMTSGELVAMQLSRKNAIVAWRGLMGPTNALVAREMHPWTLRARFGVDGTRNATHGSDAVASAKRELQFFFGGGPLAFATSEGLVKAPSSKDLAPSRLPSPYPPDETLESVLTQALDEMLSYELSTQLDACTWLGTWLLEYSQRQQLKQPEIEHEPRKTQVKSGPRTQPAKFKPQSPPIDPLEQHLGSNRTLLAISYAADVSLQLRAAVSDALSTLVSSRFVFLDVRSVLRAHKSLESGVADLVAQLKVAGKRRFLLHDMDVSSLALVEAFNTQIEWRINSAVTISSSPFQPRAIALSPLVPHVFYQLPLQFDRVASDASFMSFFSELLSPVLIVVYDPQERVEASRWRAMAQHFGYVLLTFDELVRQRVASERDPNGVFTQLVRTRTRIPTELLLSLVRDGVRSSQSASPGADHEALGWAQKFLLCGFPLGEALPTELETSVGPVHRLLCVHSSQDSGTVEKDAHGWISYASKRGALSNLVVDSDTVGNELRETCALSLGPVVGLCLGQVQSDEQLGQLTSVVRTLGFTWVDVRAMCPPEEDNLVVVAKLRRILLRVNAGREKWLLYGFPLAKAALVVFLEDVCMPRFAILSTTVDTKASSDLDMVVATLDVFPQIVQLDISQLPETDSSSSLGRLQSVLFGKRVSFLVGDTKELSSSRLQSAIAAHGYTVVDIRKHQQQQEHPPEVDTLSNDAIHCQVRSLISQLQSSAAPRCLVLGASEHVSFFQALEAFVGCAIDRLVLLRHIERQAPPRGGPKRDDDEDDYSDDDDELERQRQLKARAALPKDLDELLQFYTARQQPSVITSKVAFYSADDKVYEQIRGFLRPVVLAVVGHPHTFYARALSTVAKRHALGLLPRGWWGSGTSDRQQTPAQQMTRLARLVAGAPFAILFADGFPRPTSADAAPYIAQQLWALERQVARVPALVLFTASMDVLVERRLEGVTRNALEDAQDALDAETKELVALFAANQQQQQLRRVLSVTCERELVDTQEELEEALKRASVLY